MNISTLARPTLVWTMLVIAPVFAADEVSAPSLVGRWHATVVVNGVEIPFEFEIAKRSGGLAGSFFNGDRRITSTGSRADGGRRAPSIRSVRGRRSMWRWRMEA